MKNLANLKFIIDKNNVIFFDIFNTLLRRNCSTNNIFKIVEEKYNTINKKNINFYKKRINAEKKARKHCTYREVNIDEIYNFLNCTDKDLLKKLEIETEIQLTQTNDDIIDYYNYCLEKQKQIFIISDMYLPETELKKILSANNIHGYYKIYSSCDYRITKWENGLLFKKVIEENHLDIKSIVHIGDDLRADYQMALKQGISAFHYKQASYRFYKNGLKLTAQDELQYDILNKFIQNNFPKNKNRAFEIGYEIFGPLLFGCSKWLEETVNKLNIKKIFFFSRDGYIWQKGFNKLNTNIENQYFYISRKSIILPILQYCTSFNEMLNCYKSFPKAFKISFLLDKFGLKNYNLDSIIKRYNYSLQTEITIKQIINDKKLKDFCEELVPIIKHISKVESNNLLKYFEQENFNGNIAIVDIGAGCSIEFALKKLIKNLNLNINFTPLYLNINSKVSNITSGHSFLDLQKKDFELNLSLRFFYMLFELFYSAPHGSVNKYTLDKSTNKIKILFDNYEYDNNSQIKIKELHNGALYFIDILNKKLSSLIQFNSKIATTKLYTFGLYPSYSDTTYFGNIKFDSNEFKNLISQSNNVFTFSNLKNGFNDSLWQSGFIIKYFKCRFSMKIFYFIYKIKKIIFK